MTTIPNTAVRAFQFDYEHGGFLLTPEGRAARDATALWLLDDGQAVEYEDSGDLYRIVVAGIEGYFWPEDATEERWRFCV